MKDIRGDWVNKTAVEIEAIGRIGIHLSLHEVVTIIEKHCPFKMQALYIERPRCWSCKHWDPPVATLPGRCLTLGIPADKNFGCVEWREK